MDTFTRLYLDTIHPLSPYSRLCSADVLCSIVLHTIVYILLIKIIDNIFILKIPVTTYKKLFCFLISVMIVGYIGRLARAKSLYKSLNNNTEKTETIMHNGYFKYFFIG